MATVYKASDLANDNASVAVKLLNRGSGDVRLLDKVFDREYSALRRLEHPNIVRMLDGGRDDETSHRFLVFEWVDTDLERRLRERRGTSWGWDDFYETIGESVLAALACAHDLEVAHRDITPANILITADGSPRVTDFGIAKIASDFAPGMTVGDFRTEPYAPPSGEEFQYLFTRDIYSWAAVALIAVSGVDPYDEQYVDRPKASLDDALEHADIPAEIASFLGRCISREPSDRPSDANVALSDLRKIHGARRDAARAAGLIERPTYYLNLTGKVRDALRTEFDVSSDDEASSLLIADLSDEVGFLPLKSSDFDSEGHFYLLGADLRLHVEIVAERLMVRRVTQDSSSFLDRERERAHRVFAKFVVGLPRDKPSAEQALVDLRNAIVDRAAEDERLKKEAGQRRIFSVWRQTLAALTQIERGREQVIEFSSFTRHPMSVEFVLTQDAPEDVLGQQRVTELVDGGVLSGEVVGVEADKLVMRVVSGEARRLPARGRLRVDTRMGRAALRRQEVALDVVQRRAAARPELEDLLLDPATAGQPVLAAEPVWRQPNLDEAKRTAVRAALGAPDALIVEGPPGTGKTTFITELIVQELVRNPQARILVSSQTHAALDNVLERLADLEPELVLLRLGRPGDDRISPRVRPLLIGRQLDEWRRDVIREGRSAVRSWARARGLSERDVEIAMRYEELGSIAESQAEVDEQRGTRQARLDDLREQRRRGVETANETIGSVQDEIGQLDDQQRDLDLERAELADRLRELGAIGDANDLDGVDPHELRARADHMVDRSHPAYEECGLRIRLLADWHARFGRGPEFEAAALIRAQVVAATCVGFGGTPGWDAIEFDVCIVDEASKATATELLIPMVRAKRWVLVGDHRQLPPYLDEALLDPGLLREQELTEEEVRDTLFERLRNELPESCRFVLSMQHRMVPAIGDLISTCFYDGKLRSAEKERPPWLAMALPQPVVWLSTSHLPGRREERAGTSHSNPLEARCIANLLGALNLLAGAAGERLSIGVLTGYAEQRDEIERRVAERRSEWTHLEIDCNTVDAFQGRQVDIAIYSVTRSNVRGRLGFLQERRRLNVALSRGRIGLAVVGDDEFSSAAHGDNPFNAVIRYINSDPRACIDEARP